MQNVLMQCIRPFRELFRLRHLKLVLSLYLPPPIFSNVRATNVTKRVFLYLCTFDLQRVECAKHRCRLQYFHYVATENI